MAGHGLKGKALDAAGRIAAKTGARLICDTFTARLERGAGRTEIERLAYFGEQALEQLAGVDLIVLVETVAPVSFFAYPGKPSELTPEGALTLSLAKPSEDGPWALTALADALDAAGPAKTNPLKRPDMPSGDLTVGSAGQIIAALLPGKRDRRRRSGNLGNGGYPLCAGAPPHDWLSLTGGSIGLGLPLATGAAVACPGPQGGLPSRRRRCDVHRASPVDPGPREP